MKDTTAQYKLTLDNDGKYRYRFFCDLSGALEYISKPVSKGSSEKELQKVWISEAKEHFNYCKKCGRWVNTVMFNADVLECVACAPWEDTPNFCPHCGKKVVGSENDCTYCGKPLRYNGR